MNEQDQSSQTATDLLFMREAVAVGRETDNPNFKTDPADGVGAILVMDGKELARSANVVPPQLKKLLTSGELVLTPETIPAYIEHSERAAIYTAVAAERPVKGATMYSTRFPCAECARAMVWSGVERLVVARGFEGETTWRSSQEKALHILNESGVPVRYLAHD
ncbi:MAG: deaminase [Mesorhizobium sp.]